MKNRKRTKKNKAGKLTSSNTKPYKKVIQVVEVKAPITYTHDELLQALYWVWEGFDRVLFNFFAVYDTAHSIINNLPLKGDHIDVGIRYLEWCTRTRGIFDIIMGKPEKETEEYCIYRYNGVPVVVHIFDDMECTRSLNIIAYENEYFKTPNSFDTFIGIFGDTWTLAQ